MPEIKAPMLTVPTSEGVTPMSSLSMGYGSSFRGMSRGRGRGAAPTTSFNMGGGGDLASILQAIIGPREAEKDRQLERDFEDQRRTEWGKEFGARKTAYEQQVARQRLLARVKITDRGMQQRFQAMLAANEARSLAIGQGISRVNTFEEVRRMIVEQMEVRKGAVDIALKNTLLGIAQTSTMSGDDASAFFRTEATVNAILQAIYLSTDDENNIATQAVAGIGLGDGTMRRTAAATDLEGTLDRESYRKDLMGKILESGILDSEAQKVYMRPPLQSAMMSRIKSELFKQDDKVAIQIGVGAQRASRASTASLGVLEGKIDEMGDNTVTAGRDNLLLYKDELDKASKAAVDLLTGKGEGGNEETSFVTRNLDFGMKPDGTFFPEKGEWIPRTGEVFGKGKGAVTRFTGLREPEFGGSNTAKDLILVLETGSTDAVRARYPVPGTRFNTTEERDAYVRLLEYRLYSASIEAIVTNKGTLGDILKGKIPQGLKDLGITELPHTVATKDTIEKNPLSTRLSAMSGKWINKQLSRDASIFADVLATTDVVPGVATRRMSGHVRAKYAQPHQVKGFNDLTRLGMSPANATLMMEGFESVMMTYQAMPRGPERRANIRSLQMQYPAMFGWYRGKYDTRLAPFGEEIEYVRKIADPSTREKMGRELNDQLNTYLFELEGDLAFDPKYIELGRKYAQQGSEEPDVDTVPVPFGAVDLEGNEVEDGAEGFSIERARDPMTDTLNALMFSPQAVLPPELEQIARDKDPMRVALEVTNERLAHLDEQISFERSKISALETQGPETTFKWKPLDKTKYLAGYTPDTKEYDEASALLELLDLGYSQASEALRASPDELPKGALKQAAVPGLNLPGAQDVPGGQGTLPQFSNPVTEGMKAGQESFGPSSPTSELTKQLGQSRVFPSVQPQGSQLQGSQPRVLTSQPLG